VMCEQRANSDAVLAKVNRIINELRTGVLEVEVASTSDTRADDAYGAGMGSPDGARILQSSQA
jgi:hypothetical protein